MGNSFVCLQALVVSWLLIVPAAARADTCPFDRNPALRGASFERLFQWASAIPAIKDEFQTTSKYKTVVAMRLSVAAASLRRAQQNFGGVVASRPVGYAVTYNADRDLILIKNDSRYAPTLLDYILDDAYREYYGVKVNGKYVPLGDTDAQNGFGAKVVVHQSADFEDTVAFFGGTSRRWENFFHGNIAIKSPPDKAKLLISRLEVAVAGRLSAPFSEKGERHEKATFTHPYEALHSYRIVHAKPICAVIRNSVTHEIYAKWIAPRS